jgi:hypothetical protein
MKLSQAFAPELRGRGRARDELTDNYDFLRLNWEDLSCTTRAVIHVLAEHQRHVAERGFCSARHGRTWKTVTRRVKLLSIAIDSTCGKNDRFC